MIWFMLSAEKENHVAQYHLGFIHYQGYGKSNDCLVAFLWWLKSAKKFDTDAWFSIVRKLVAGHDVSKNEFKALKWFYHADRSIKQIRVLEGKGFKITEHKKRRSVNQLISETGDILKVALELKEKENKMLRGKGKRPRSKKPTKEELKQSFNPFAFRTKRK